ncbi:MAG: penicillin-insensitive murein endopeptidase [Aurantimonas endophytica]|uniref:penicillin-insensitive murein endopeptidase n=1 Tax=Aurantimonas endophytica TaxID=1522175 RepID=UPI00300271B0
MMATGRKAGRLAATLLALVLAAGAANAEPPAKELFAAKASPAALAPESVGFYSKGCLAGAAELPADGPHWQAMRLSRERRFGHPATIAYLQQLSDEAARRGIWPGLLVGDISQARGGPLPFGHASHQIGLDADIWLQPMPAQRLTQQAREDFAFRSVLREGTLTVDDRIWTDNYRDLIRLAADSREVQRVFVHPGIKKKLCETAGRDRAWLNKVRPIYGHHEHFHVRLRCQPGSAGCTPQESTGSGDGCGDLGWWFNVALKPPPPNAKPAKPKRPMGLADLPNQCRVVLNAPGMGSGNPVLAAAPRDAVPGALSYAPTASVPIPTSRPLQ